MSTVAVLSVQKENVTCRIKPMVFSSQSSVLLSLFDLRRVKQNSDNWAARHPSVYSDSILTAWFRLWPMVRCSFTVKHVSHRLPLVLQLPREARAHRSGKDFKTAARQDWPTPPNEPVKILLLLQEKEERTSHVPSCLSLRAILGKSEALVGNANGRRLAIRGESKKPSRTSVSDVSYARPADGEAK